MNEGIRLTQVEMDYVVMLLARINKVKQRIDNVRTLPYYRIFSTEMHRQKDIDFLNRRKANLLNLYNQTIQ